MPVRLQPTFDRQKICWTNNDEPDEQFVSFISLINANAANAAPSASGGR
jgi:hypothetical protein